MAVLGWKIDSILLLGVGSPVGEDVYQLTSGMAGRATLQPSDRLARRIKIERPVLGTCKGLVPWSVVASHDSVVPAEPGDQPALNNFQLSFVHGGRAGLSNAYRHLRGNFSTFLRIYVHPVGRYGRPSFDRIQTTCFIALRGRGRQGQ